MMTVRILHCGESIENYNTCIEEKVVGFTRRTANIGDTIYIALKKNGKTYCGARGVIITKTDEKPWLNSDSYVQAFKISSLEFCEPFPLTILSEVGGKAWAVKYMQGSKEIKDERAIVLLEKEFTSNPHKIVSSNDPVVDVRKVVTIDEDFTEEDEISIMGTFVTMKFYSEQHKTMGLESLVNKNFYSLFQDEYTEENTILMTNNRMFSTATIQNKSTNKNINGISGIPDALLINFTSDKKAPLQINLIEYECYGLLKDKPIDKFNYLNGHIIPQLMRFASAFSVVTDNRIREKTVDNWMDKIINSVYEDKELSSKVYKWVKEIHPDINSQKISFEFQKLLHAAFNSQLRIMLIIDELTSEQKDTLKNVINSFKLNSENSIEFLGFVVRLEQRMGVIDSNAEYALSIQK